VEWVVGTRGAVRGMGYMDRELGVEEVRAAEGRGQESELGITCEDYSYVRCSGMILGTMDRWSREWRLDVVNVMVIPFTIRRTRLSFKPLDLPVVLRTFREYFMMTILPQPSTPVSCHLILQHRQKGPLVRF
jgi:hypothetical protein